ncbi:MAG: DUF4382 domain-containing protein [Thermoplasmatota archaeon]
MAFRALAPVALLIVLALSGCSQSDDGSSGAMGSASVYVKDAPADEFDEIHVVFTKVQVHAAGSDDDEADSDGNETEDDGAGGEDADDGNETEDDGNSTSGWKTLFEDSAGVDVDLLNVTGTRAAFLGEEDLAAGKYTQVRITVDEVYGIANGTRVPITLSGGTLKLNHPFEVGDGSETRIVLDIDLERSLHQQGNGSWRMTPVIGSVDSDEVDDDKSGEDHDDEGEIRDLEDDD